MRHEIKTAEQIARIAAAGSVLAACRERLRRLIHPGLTTLEIDRFVERFLEEKGAVAEQKGYQGYPYATCTSVNEVACHGMPGRAPLRNGDIVTVDMVVNVGGWLADSAWTFPVGETGPKANRLMRAAKQCLYAGIRKARPGSRTGDIAHAIREKAHAYGYSIVREFTGHGIGRSIHEHPPVPHIGKQGKGELLEPGMVITIEPILTVGSPRITIEADGWTARTADRSWAAQYEHTVAVTAEGPLILTELRPVLFPGGRIRNR